MLITVDYVFQHEVDTDQVKSVRLDDRPGLECLVVTFKSGDVTYFGKYPTCDVFSAYQRISEALS
jgi:hypothetical protein